ncbi:hypothetical protein [Aliiruegeria lutimaris]|uniref:Uncharacterized protein n=1 Tax=Aliiruegeria lutimaris TaxID=571298 RepID=A0A1G8U8I6_9RHOB|nr:hypothetical protein [Aliiruegeria lutimaris]SDJ50049.1 hypothetical protein SAMN04488026_101882 [Aliiruegeria lutimaris]
MIASFVFSLLAGFLTLYVEGPLSAWLKKTDLFDLRLDAMELRILSFGLMLLLAAIATALVGANSSAYMAVSGGLLGYFGGDLYAYMRDPDGAQGEESDDWDGDVVETGPRRRLADHMDADQLDTENEETLRAVQAAIQDETRPEEEKDR